MKQTERPIAVFDSGVGGISVLRELVRLMPNENYIFFGDSKNAPYGGKSLEEVRKLTECHVRHLLSEGAKAVVIACNTATSADVSILRKEYPDVPVVGIEPYVPDETFFQKLSTSSNARNVIITYKDKVIGGYTCIYNQGNAFLWFSAFKRKTYIHLHPEKRKQYPCRPDACNRRSRRSASWPSRPSR